MALVREDKHGKFVKVGGYIFRPVFPVDYQHIYKSETQLNAGDTVKASHIGGSQLGRVGVETWFSHGAYMGNPKYNGSESCFKPSYERW